MATVTLDKTGREIMEAVKAGKPVMVHYADGNYEEYDAPVCLGFNEADDAFYMTVHLSGDAYAFSCSLDDTPTSGGAVNDDPDPDM